MKKNKIIVLIGYGNWGKKIYKCLKKRKNIKLIVFSKRKRNKKGFEQLNNINNLDKYKIDFIFGAVNAKMHEKIFNYSYINKIPFFIEKPLTENKNFLKNIKESHFGVINYIFAKYLCFLKLNRSIKFDNLNISLCSTSRHRMTNKKILWEYFTHCLSILFYFKNIKIKNMEIKNIKNYLYIKIYLNNNRSVNCKIGNKFKKNNKRLVINSKNKKYKYNFLNHGKISPLENSINDFFSKKNYTNDIILTKKITNLINQII